MNFKKITFFLSVNFITLTSLAQVVSKLDGKSNKPEPTLNFQKISVNGNDMYMLGIVSGNKDKSEYYVEKYNAEDLSLVYQKNLNINIDDKNAMTRPLFTPPVCFESKGNIIVFYNSFLEKEKVVQVNYKLVAADGNVSSKFQTLISSKDIDVLMDGMFQNFEKPDKPIINYIKSKDNSSIIIEITATNYKKIFIYKIEDLLAGILNKKEIDTKNLYDKDKITILDCFYENNNFLFSFIADMPNKKTVFGVGEYDFNLNKFDLHKQDIAGIDVFAMDYLFLKDQDKIFFSGYERILIDPAKKRVYANAKVKILTLNYNLKTKSFENKQELDFQPGIKKIISEVKKYKHIDKSVTADNFLEKIEILQGDNFIFQISHLYFRREPGPGNVSALNGGGGGVGTISRDIIVSKFDKSGKLLNQFLIPKCSVYNTFAGSMGANLKYFCNKTRYFAYTLLKDDLHFIHLDNSRNILVDIDKYIPDETPEAFPGTAALAHVTLKNDNLKKEFLIESRTTCFFYVEHNMVFKNSVIVDVEQKKGYEIGKITFD